MPNKEQRYKIRLCYVVLVIAVLFVLVVILKRDVLVISNTNAQLAENLISDNKRLYDNTALRIKDNLDKKKKSTLAEVNRIAEEISSYSTAFQLMLYMLRDKASGGDSFAQAINNLTAIHTGLLNEMYSISEIEVISFEQNLAEKDTDLRISIGAGLPNIKDVKHASRYECKQKFDGLKDTAFSAGISVFSEAMFFKSSYNAIRSTVFNTSSLVATRVGSGALIASADGPLPIGDAIGIALSSLSIYDVVKLRKELYAVSLGVLTKATEDIYKQLIQLRYLEMEESLRIYNASAKEILGVSGEG